MCLERNEEEVKGCERGAPRGFERRQNKFAASAARRYQVLLREAALVSEMPGTTGLRAGRWWVVP